MSTWDEVKIKALNEAADAIVERGKGSGGTTAFMNGIAAAEKAVRSLIPCSKGLLIHGRRVECGVLGPHDQHRAGIGIASVIWSDSDRADEVSS